MASFREVASTNGNRCELGGPRVNMAGPKWLVPGVLFEPGVPRMLLTVETC